MGISTVTFTPIESRRFTMTPGRRNDETGSRKGKSTVAQIDIYFMMCYCRCQTLNIFSPRSLVYTLLSFHLITVCGILIDISFSIVNVVNQFFCHKFAISLVGAEKQRKSLNHLFLLSLPFLITSYSFTVFNHHPTLTSIIFIIYIYIFIRGHIRVTSLDPITPFPQSM